MRRLLRLRVALATVFVLALAGPAGCHATRDGVDLPLVLLLSPWHGGEAADRERLASAIHDAGRLDVEVVVAPTTQAAVLRAGTATWDAAILPLFDYLFCHQQYGVHAGLQVLRHDGQRTHEGEILVRAGSGIADLRGLSGRKLAFADHFSTSGFLFPARLLADEDVRPETSFAGSHEDALAQLRAGKVDAAAAWAGIGQGDPLLLAVARTEPIPNEPVFFRRDLGADARSRLQTALLAVASAPGGAETLRPFADITGLAPASDGDFLTVHEAIRAAGSRVEDLVPQGWRLRHESERSLLGDFAL